jgi:hypothetical protein
MTVWPIDTVEAEQVVTVQRDNFDVAEDTKKNAPASSAIPAFKAPWTKAASTGWAVLEEPFFRDRAIRDPESIE